MALCHRLFEFRKANLRLFDMEHIVSFSEALVAKNCPVIHNNSFVTRIGGQFGWHQDDSPHYLVTEVIPGSHLFGKPCPDSFEGTEWEDRIHYYLGQAGSVIKFNNQVWYRGGPNRTSALYCAGDLRPLYDRA